MDFAKCKLLIPVFLLFSLAATGSHAAVIAHWTFDEGSDGNVASGSGSVLDSSGNGLHGTPFGNPVYTGLPGGETGLDFSNDFVLVDDSSLFVSNSMTVEAIVSIDSLPSAGALSQIVFRGDHQAGRDPFYLALLGNNLRWYIEGPTPGAVALHYDVSSLTNEFLHLAGTINDDTNEMKLFVNGTEVGSTTTTIRPTYPITPNDPCGVSIGALEDCNVFANPGQYFDGIIDEVRISDIALTPDQFLRASVPEPATLALLGLGMAGLGLTRRKRIS